jgi:hypothetical protein
MRDPNPLQSLRTALGLIAGSNLLTDPESLPGMFENYECFYSRQPDHLAVVGEIKTMWEAGSLPEVPVSYRRVLLNEPEPVEQPAETSHRREVRRPRKPSLDKLIAKAKAAGARSVVVGGVEMRFGEPQAEQTNDLDKWMAKRHAN